MGCCESKPHPHPTPQVRNPQIPSVSVEEVVNASKGICHIYIQYKNQTIEGTGFFVEINPVLTCLLTNYHVISKEIVDVNSIIEIKNNSNNKIDLKLNKNERFIKFFKDDDITVIQIKNTDGINKYFKFLNYDLNYKDGFKKYKDASIFVAHYPGNEAENASGKIIEINGNEFTHEACTDAGSSGSPVILISNSRVIGIHKGGNSDCDELINYGTFIGAIFEEINKEYAKISDMNNYKVLDKTEKVNNNSDNYIIAEFLIDNRNINKDILIINSYEKMKGNTNTIYLDEKLKNEKKIKECEIRINGEKINFSYNYNFKREGTYKIKYSFKNLTNINHMFCECSSLINIDLSKLNTENVTNMSYMFGDCSLLLNIDLSNINTKKVIDMEGIFYGCSSLVNLDLSYFDTKIIVNMSYAFGNCSSLKNIDLSNFNTRNVTDMSSMFSGCSSLGNIYLPTFNTQKVIDMSLMFADCESLQKLDLSSFDTRNVTNMDEMFVGCKSLTYLDLSNFTTPNIVDIEGMFICCDSLQKENLKTKDKNILKEFDTWKKIDEVGGEYLKKLFKE